MATFTTPKTWTGGSVLTAAELDTYLRDNVQWLYDRGFSGVKHVRLLVGATINANDYRLDTVTWAEPFADANYTVYVSAVGAFYDILCNPDTPTAASVDLRTHNGFTSGQRPTLHVLAIHD